MPYVLPCSDGPWEDIRPRGISLLIVSRTFRIEDNTDTIWRSSVAYPEIGTLVLYFPGEHDEEADHGWWKVHILRETEHNVQWVHPGILARIRGNIYVEGDGLRNAWPAAPNRMCCHLMGEKRKPADSELVHVGYCEACLRRMARFSSFFRHLHEAVRLLETTDVLTLVCTRGKHRSFALGHEIVTLTSCSFSKGGPRMQCGCVPPCNASSAETCAQILLDSLS